MNFLSPIKLSENITFTPGLSDFPAFKISGEPHLYFPSSQFFPEDEISSNFSLLVTVRPSSDDGGVLLAIMDPTQTQLTFGLELGPTSDSGKANISIYFSQRLPVPPDTPVPDASFEVPGFRNKWQRFSLALGGNKLELYLECIPHGEAVIAEEHFGNGLPLSVPNSSSLAIFHGGKNFGRPYLVRTNPLYVPYPCA